MKTRAMSSIHFVVLLLCAAGLSFAGAAKDVLSDEEVHLPSFGVTFLAPNEWYRPNLKEYVKNIESFDRLKEEELRSLISKQGSIPLAAFHKYDPQTAQGPIPTLTVLVRPNPTTQFKEFEEYIKWSFDSLPEYFNNLSQTIQPSEVVVSGKKSLIMEIEYDLNMADGIMYRIRNITFAIPFENTFLQIGMTEEDPPQNTGLFVAFIDSLRIAGD